MTPLPSIYTYYSFPSCVGLFLVISRSNSQLPCHMGSKFIEYEQIWGFVVLHASFMTSMTCAIDACTHHFFSFSIWYLIHCSLQIFHSLSVLVSVTKSQRGLVFTLHLSYLHSIFQFILFWVDSIWLLGSSCRLNILHWQDQEKPTSVRSGSQMCDAALIAVNYLDSRLIQTPIISERSNSDSEGNSTAQNVAWTVKNCELLNHLQRPFNDSHNHDSLSLLIYLDFKFLVNLRIITKTCWSKLWGDSPVIHRPESPHELT